MRKTLGILLTVLGLSPLGILLALAIAHLWGGFRGFNLEGSSAAPVLVLIAAALIALGWSAAPFILRYASRLLAPGASSALGKDLRRPIVLLRSFGDDEAFWLRKWGPYSPLSLEQVIADGFAQFGPVIAIGRPAEWAPPLGAARKYVSENWQGEVLQLIEGSQYVVVVLAGSTGLVWELEQLVRVAALSKVIFVLPPVKHAELQKRWQILVDIITISVAETISMPTVVPADAVFVTFGLPGRCVIYEARGVRTAWLLRKMNYHYTKPLDVILKRCQ